MTKRLQIVHPLLVLLFWQFFSACGPPPQEGRNPSLEQVDVALRGWEGTYSYYHEDGEDPIGAQIFHLRTITIRRDSCFYYALGYQSYYNELVSPTPSGDSLHLTFLKILDGTSWHDEHPEIGILYRAQGKYWFQTPAGDTTSKLEMIKE